MICVLTQPDRALMRVAVVCNGCGVEALAIWTPGLGRVVLDALGRKAEDLPRTWSFKPDLEDNNDSHTCWECRSSAARAIALSAASA